MKRRMNWDQVESRIVALIDERASRANGKPLILRPSSPDKEKRGATSDAKIH